MLVLLVELFEDKELLFSVAPAVVALAVVLFAIDVAPRSEALLLSVEIEYLLIVVALLLGIVVDEHASAVDLFNMTKHRMSYDISDNILQNNTIFG